MQAVAPPFNKSYPPPRDKDMLATYITEAAMIEQQFMCQYLYAAFSLKKQPDATCSPAQLEFVRRWASQIYMIARQEMEHLSIANSLLTAIGHAPWFGHDNFPTQSRWYTAGALQKKNIGLNAAPTPCDFPFLLQAFDVQVAKRFCCMESPTLNYVSPQDQVNVTDWCYEPGGCGCVPEVPTLIPPSRTFVGASDQSANAVEPGTVQELYAAIKSGLEYLNQELGSKALFSGHQSGQSQIPSEYNIYLFSICDLDTAVAGIKLITSQGEGIDTPPGYDSHFQNYYDMVVEYEALLENDPTFEPSLPLPLDPQLDQYTDPITSKAVKAFDDGYVAMLYMLSAYYANYLSSAYDKPPYLFQALEQTVFAPTMTMLIRSLAELITQLPGNAPGETAGPVFYLSPEALKMLSHPSDPIFLDINFHRANLEAVAYQLELVINEPELGLALRPKFEYVHQNVLRMVANLSYIYQNGTYTKFVNLPSCPQDDGCE
jgi:Ferritin-like